MASLTNTSINGIIRARDGVYPAGSNVTPWYRIYHCADGTDTNPVYAGGWLHIRTPLPATNAAPGMGWNPSIVEVVGFHTYDGGYTHDFKTVINSSGYSDNSWYSNTTVNVGNTTPYVYRSSGTYGSYQRVCIAVPKVGCCCVGWIWVRWWGNSGYRDNYAWATIGRANNTAYF